MDAMTHFKPHLPVGGHLKYFLSEWRKITSDPSVLDIVKGMHIELTDFPKQKIPPKPLSLTPPEINAANDQIQKLLEKKAIVETVREPGDFVSNVFLTPKQDGGFQMILNLKRFNQFVQYHHFKMECLSHILSTIVKDAWMCVFDFTNAYLMVGIASEHVKFLKFEWQGKLYMYVVLPFRIASAPRQFTKVLKPILAFIRCQGIIVLTYIDDGFTTAITYSQCLENVCYIMRTFSRFGFLIHKIKSAPILSHQVRSLGFYLNSVTMSITLPPEKVHNTIQLCQAILTVHSFTVQLLAQVIGTLISLFPACPLGRTHYRTLERLKVRTLHLSYGNYDACCTPDSPSFHDINWWLKNVPHTAAPISQVQIVHYSVTVQIMHGEHISKV